MHTTATTHRPVTLDITSGDEHATAILSSGRQPIEAQAHDYDGFTAAKLSQVLRTDDGYSSVHLTAFDADGRGSHSSAAVHGAVTVTIDDGLYGPSIVIRTVTGQTFRIDTFAPGDDPDDLDRPAVTVTDNREAQS